MDVLLVIFFLALLALGVGIYKPSLFKMDNRLTVAKVLVSISLVLFIIVMFAL